MAPGGQSIGLPAALRGVDGAVLEDYVGGRILEFAGTHAFARRLYASPEMARAAAREALEELRQPGGGGGQGGRSLQLVFRHACLNQGCLGLECGLCRSTQHRRCVADFAPKYLSGDAVKAKCGATIAIEALDCATGQPAGQQALEGLHAEICVLEGKSYGEAPPQRQSQEAFLDANTLLTNAQGRELLAPWRQQAELTADRRVVTRFSNGKAALAVNVVGSSIAMLSGQKPPFRLLVRAIDSKSGARAAHVAPIVSDAFVVATQRVKGAQKAEIPHVEEHVSKLESVGVQTQSKLLDIAAAAAAAGHAGLSVVHSSVTTVGQFKELVDSTADNPRLQDALRRALNFTSKAWEAAVRHVGRAVATDNRMRVWVADDAGSRGLLFRCHLGRVDLEAPVGLLSGNPGGGGGGGGRQLHMAALLTQHPRFDRLAAACLRSQAAAAWWRPGHPGWTVWPADSEQFVRGVAEAAEGGLQPVAVVAEPPATPHARYPAEEAGSPDVAARPGSSATASQQQQQQPGGGGSDGGQPGPRQRQQQQGGARSSGGQSRVREDREDSASLNGGLAAPGAGNGSERQPSAHLPPAASGLTGSQPPGGLRHGAWPLSLPVVNRQPLAQAAALPASPFDVPSAAPQRASAAGEGFSFRPASGTLGAPAAQLLQAPPSQLPSLSTLELEQIFGPHVGWGAGRGGALDSSGSLQLAFLSSLNSLEPVKQEEFLTRLSGLLSNAGAGAQQQGQAQAPPGQERGSGGWPPRPPGPEQDGALPPVAGEALPLRFSGKVSGILDDLSDAMSMLQDLLPSAASDAHLQMHARSMKEAAAASNGGPSAAPQLPPPQGLGLQGSAEGSTGLSLERGSPGAPKRQRVR